MQVTVGSQIRVDNPTPELVAWCKETLILPNPDYAKKARMHLWLGNPPQTISLVEQDGNVLKKWYMLAPGVNSFEAFREHMEKGQ